MECPQACRHLADVATVDGDRLAEPCSLRNCFGRGPTCREASSGVRRGPVVRKRGSPAAVVVFSVGLP